MMFALNNPEGAKVLTKVGEECAEVLQELAKIQLWGLWSAHPSEPHKGTNQQRLERELGDLMYWIERADQLGLVNKQMVGHWAAVKEREMAPEPAR